MNVFHKPMNRTLARLVAGTFLNVATSVSSIVTVPLGSLRRVEEQVKVNQTMYEQNVYYPDVFKGCLNDCVYCKPSFQRQAKRQLHRCKVLNEKGVPKCYSFEPHIHEERMYTPLGDNKFAYRVTPKTVGDQFVFFPKGGDPCYATLDELEQMFDFIDNNPQTTFLMQTKVPECFEQINQFPENLILGITLESDRELFQTPSQYKAYCEISKAATLGERVHLFSRVNHKRKFVTVEPILQFRLDIFVTWLRCLKPQAVYVGYDTKGCKLPEPTLVETLALIEALEKEGIEVRRKTIRKAWYETESLEVS